ncbi:MAG: SRPBCC family protein [Salibacteraceae bacterium]
MMKILKYILIVLAVLMIIFFGNGLITSSVTYQGKIEVNKPIEEAWAVMEDDSRISEWLPVITRIEPVSGTPGTLGAVSNIYAIENGEEMVMQETITSFDPPKHIAMTFTMDFMDMKYEMHLTEQNGKTLIASKSKTVGNGLFSKSILSFMGGMMEAQENENLHRLKMVIEGTN